MKITIEISDSLTSKIFDLVKPNIDESEYVDLGLPSGTKWCSHNVGAESEFKQGALYERTNIPKIDPFTKSEVIVPSTTQVHELFEFCDIESVTKQGVNGVNITSKLNGNKIFIPKEQVHYIKNSCGYDYISHDSISLFTSKMYDECTFDYLSIKDDEYRICLAKLYANYFQIRSVSK